MMWTNKISDEVLDIITPYSDWFFSQDLTPLDEISRNKDRKTHDIHRGCGEEYLKEIVDKDGAHEGYPEETYSVDIGMLDCLPYDNRHIDVIFEHQKKRQEMSLALTTILGARNQAVNVYYPAGGFMGWHNNWNAAGYNILLTYSQDGDGFFRYRDPKTHKIITMEDRVGWSCKVGYYGRGREPDKVYYHCAGSNSPRLTLGFIIPDLDMWRDMIEDITGEDASHFS